MESVTVEDCQKGPHLPIFKLDIRWHFMLLIGEGLDGHLPT